MELHGGTPFFVGAAFDRKNGGEVRIYTPGSPAAMSSASWGVLAAEDNQIITPEQISAEYQATQADLRWARSTQTAKVKVRRSPLSDRRIY